MGSSQYVDIAPLLHELHWIPEGSWVQLEVVIVTFKVLHGMGTVICRTTYPQWYLLVPLELVGNML